MRWALAAGERARVAAHIGRVEPHGLEQLDDPVAPLRPSGGHLWTMSPSASSSPTVIRGFRLADGPEHQLDLAPKPAQLGAARWATSMRS